MTYLDLTGWRMIHVTGGDAVEWLEDLVSAGISGLREDETRRSLLLTPTGRIRADFLVTRFDDGLLLVQDPIQPSAIDELLARYVLSSDVKLDPQSDLSLFAVPDGDELHVIFDRPEGEPEDLDAWRIPRGIARFGVDLDKDSLPQEAGWERYIDFTKGCFMGQEAMAKVRMFGGHPTRVVLALRSEEPGRVDDSVVTGDQEVGVVTSAAGTGVIARVAWTAREAKLRTAKGAELSDRA